MPRNDVLEILKKLPPVAFVDNAGGKANTRTDAPLVAIKRGESGCYPIYSPHSADWHNEAEGVTKAQAMAMYMGSMFGWEVPAADPDNYDSTGRPLPSPPTAHSGIQER